jgi:hypothetical protein
MIPERAEDSGKVDQLSAVKRDKVAANGVV